MEWYIEFEGMRRPLRTVSHTQVAAVCALAVKAVQEAIERTEAAPTLDGIVFVEADASWGIRLEGPVHEVERAAETYRSSRTLRRLN